MSLGHAARRVLNTFLPGRIKTVDDSGAVQRLQIDHGGQGGRGSQSLHDAVARLGEFGFFSSPPADSDAAVICVGGDRTNAVVIATAHKPSRIKNVPPGDAGIHDVRGAYVWLTATGLKIDAAGLKVTIQNASDINITGSGTVTITAAHVNLISGDVNLGGTGGHKVALVGDAVAGGVITGPGATKVKAV